MALAALLSAMKEIILDAPELPGEAEARKEFFRKSYPDLSLHEAEDLAKIEPSKFKIYTFSIFSAERDLIQRNFGMTLEYLKKHWNEVSKNEFKLIDIIKEMHKKRPWKSTHTVDLGKNFVSLIKEDLKPIHKKVPFITELSDMELLLRIVRRSPDDEVMPKHSLKIEEITAMTVADILNLRYQIPTCVEYTKFTYDLIAARSAYIENEKTVPDTIAKRNILCSLSRNRDALQRWTEYSEIFYGILNTHIRETSFPLSHLAEKFLEASDGDRTEEDLFKEFIETVYRCIETGSLVVRQ